VELLTERLRMRPVGMTDLDDLVAIHQDPVVLRFFGAMTRDDLVRWIVASQREWAERGHGRVALLDRESGAFLGRSGLRYWPEFDEVEVGWVLHPAARGRGLATEAARACFEWGFRDLDVPYLTSMIMPENTASIAVAERLALEPLREDKVFDLPVIVFALGVSG
jgi:RimJ/RimL family protein N-acetyltransferase